MHIHVLSGVDDNWDDDDFDEGVSRFLCLQVLLFQLAVDGRERLPAQTSWDRSVAEATGGAGVGLLTTRCSRSVKAMKSSA